MIQIDVYFDYASPFAYIASETLDSLPTLEWRLDRMLERLIEG